MSNFVVTVWYNCDDFDVLYNLYCTIRYSYMYHLPDAQSSNENPNQRHQDDDENIVINGKDTKFWGFPAKEKRRTGPDLLLLCTLIALHFRLILDILITEHFRPHPWSSLHRKLRLLLTIKNTKKPSSQIWVPYGNSCRAMFLIF
ncbi:hypothetical protein L1987_62341 [Smallanthus sonchifolius]|uniref:Uncharacterized protein n=1 Tax=Smallanthus sonchifolius TaxID=185202 RepID=A0ACB9CAA0_9ASTR|nr:hypothetical protein L1987_62341 [Smallanthus sonchifolius]